MSKSNIVQYVVVRMDLTKSWPLGALIAQCCHASTAISFMCRNDEIVQEYFKDLDNMHKVVLSAPDNDSLQKLSASLTDNEIKHKLWIEQPENISTCLAIKPYSKEVVHKFVKRFKLLQ